MNRTLKVMSSLAVMATLCVAGSAFADGDIFSTASDKMGALFNNVRIIVFIMGAFALVGFAIGAIFGKLEWKKVAILAVGLALLAVASQVVNYAINKEAGSELDSGKFESSIKDY